MKVNMNKSFLVAIYIVSITPAFIFPADNDKTNPLLSALILSGNYLQAGYYGGLQLGTQTITAGLIVAIPAALVTSIVYSFKNLVPDFKNTDDALLTINTSLAEIQISRQRLEALKGFLSKEEWDDAVNKHKLIRANHFLKIKNAQEIIHADHNHQANKAFKTIEPLPEEEKRALIKGEFKAPLINNPQLTNMIYTLPAYVPPSATDKKAIAPKDEDSDDDEFSVPKPPKTKLFDTVEDKDEFLGNRPPTRPNFAGSV